LPPELQFFVWGSLPFILYGVYRQPSFGAVVEVMAILIGILIAVDSGWL
jgi:hypothetical protein